ncbi:MAG TPA: type II toxin-antitoxin system VapC family toxin [Steroidobacteraceae bacterium]|nr:type II toxin-antitoxin system VapC family toxin [Steroidobacteraceae bacterium]
MRLYAESSAVLAWLLDESSATEVRRLLSGAEIIVASDLTLIECSRVLIRAVALGELNEAEASDRRAHLANAAARWHILHIGFEIVDRAKHPFPEEPIRTLDALHLASALTARAAVAGLKVLSLDDRLRASAQKLGLPLLPE